MLVLLLVGLALRLLVLRSRLGDLNADEAYTGLQSLGVIRDGRFPVVIDGANYSAVLEAYFFAPVVTLLGGSVAGLKLLFICIWAAAAAVTAGAARRLLDGRAALVAGAIVWLAPGALMVLSTRAYVCYALGMTVVAGVVWTTAIVADQATPRVLSSALVGGLAGLAFYIHPIYITVLVPTVAVAAVVHWREWRTWWLPAVAAAVVANIPFIAWNALNGWPSLKSQYFPPGTAAGRFEGFITGLLPRAFGLRSFNGEWIFGRTIGLVLYAVLVAGVVAGCVFMVRGSRRPSRWIVPVVLTTCLPAMALFPHLVYVADGRYGIVPFAFVAIALGGAASHLVGLLPRPQATLMLGAVITLWAVVTVVPFLRNEKGFERFDANAWQERVIDRLDRAGIDRVAGNYWLALPIEYRSDRSIRVAVAGDPYVVRFPGSQRIVEQTPAEQVAFLFPPGDQPPQLFRLPLDRYRREDLGGVILYLPPAARS